MKRINIISLIIILCATTAIAVEVAIDKDKMLKVDGNRTFILGLYSPRIDDFEELTLLKKAGFNLVSAPVDESKIAKIAESGLWVWVNIHSAVGSDDPQKRDSDLRNLIEKIKLQPNFLVWEMPDEALWNIYLRNFEAKRFEEPKLIMEKIGNLSDQKLKGDIEAKLNIAVNFYSKGLWEEGEKVVQEIWQILGETSPYANYSMARIEEHKNKELEKLQHAYKLLNELDYKHPVWMNHAPRNSMESLRKFSQTADIIGCDIYPVPMHPKLRHSDLMDQTMACVGAYTRRMQAIDPQKPVWMVIQGFNWGSLQGDIYERSGDEQKGFRPPTLSEIRFMGFDCIVNGARGILFWGTHYVDRNSQLWKDLLTFASEINRFKHVLAEEDANEGLKIKCDEIYGSGDRGIITLIKLHNGKPYTFIVNEWHECGIRYYISSPHFHPGMKLKEFYSGAELSLSSNVLSYGIENFGVQVWTPVD
ncbi:MAG: hypothetical protein N3G21_09730 [Candidatus Hydrogenedentes bacterium]|nr:hypothetical protein [Candidatus Hydrogenedentota bacterium]